MRCIEDVDGIDIGSSFKDTSISQLLTLIELSIPIQQFISCFYSLPNQHLYFNIYFTKQIAGHDEEEATAKQNENELDED